MKDRLKSKEELLGLLSNCIIALALLPDECDQELVLAKAAATKHMVELHERFPGWEDEIHSLAHAAKNL